jgi:hypothetical protein
MINALDFVHFLKEYHSNPGELRLGQAFCNKYPTIKDPELFYCEDGNIAIQIIADKYLNTSN